MGGRRLKSAKMFVLSFGVNPEMRSESVRYSSSRKSFLRIRLFMAKNPKRAYGFLRGCLRLNHKAWFK